uniref:Fibronectin type-III domain-containing protein n=1 Tax=Alexandrium monilatum TaxID=311494 RepID=A0A7S4S4M0_9DINO
MTPSAPQLATTASTLTVKLYEPTPVHLMTAAHTGWRILVDDANDADDIYTETPIYDTTVLEHTFSTGIIAGHPYRVKIRLCSVVGCSGESQIGGPMIAASPPAAPSQVNVISSDDQELHVGWVFTGSNGGSPITGWRIYISTDGDAWPPLGSPSATINDVNTMTYVIPCATYSASQDALWIRVAAYTVAGIGTQSATLTARCSSVPDTPAAPTVAFSNESMLTIAWSLPNSSALHNALPAGTKVLVDDGAAGPYTTIMLTDTLQNEYTRMGVFPGQTYRFRLITVSEVGESNASSVLNAVAAQTPEAPVVTIVDTTNTEITYDITLAGSTGGSPIINFNVYVSQDGVVYPQTPTAVADPFAVNETLDCTSFLGVNRGQQYFWIKAAGVTAVGEGDLSFGAKARCSEIPETPAAPTLVTSATDSVTIAFQPASLNGATLTGFRIYADDGNGGPWSVETVSDTTARTFQKTGLSPGLPYLFKVQVVTEVGVSGLSPGVTLYSAATPDPPTVSVTSSTNSEIVIAWAPGSDGGSPVTSWYVYGSRDGIAWAAASGYIYAVAGSSTSQSVSCTDDSKWGGVKVQKEYVYLRVAGENAAGMGAYSNSLRQRCSSTPDVPAAPAKVSANTTSITISYAPLGLNDAIPMGYKILVDDGLNGDFEEVYVTSTSQTEYTATNLTAGLTYRFAVKVVSEMGESAASTITSLTCGADADPPTAPTYVSSQSNNELTVEWTFPGSNGGAAITDWYVYLSDSFADSSWPLQNNPTIPISTVSTMQAVIDCTNVRGADLAQTWVYVKVAAVTDAAIGQYSPISKLFCANRPDPPSVTDDSGTTSSVTITFMEGNLYGAELRAFRIYMNDGLGGAVRYLTTVEDTSQRYYTATGLTVNREHLMQVTVVSAVTESARSATIAVRSCSRPDTPEAPTRKASTSTRITVQWVAPGSNGCPLTGYRVFLDENGDGAANQEIYPGTGDANDPLDLALDPTVLEFEKTGLTTGQKYGFKLRAYNARGYRESVWSTIKAASEPLQMAAPTQNIGASTADSIALSWVVPDLQGGTAVGYKVFRNDGGGTQISTVPDETCGMRYNPAPQRCSITGLTPGQDYLFQMLTVNDIGEGPLSTTTTLKSATVPATIDTLLNSASTFSPPSLTFAWQTPADNGATIYNYKGELHKVDDGSVQVWDGTGTPNTPYTSTTLLLSGNGNYGLAPNTQFKFRVKGENIMGLADWSEWTSLSNAPRGFTLDAPDTPPNFGRHSDPPSAGTIKLGWDLFTATAETGGDAIASITYEVWGGATTPLQLLTMTNDQNNHHSETVPDGDTWSFKVRSKNSAGLYSPFSATLSMISAGVPGKTNLTSATSLVPGQVVMSWQAPAFNGDPITGYEVSNNNFGSAVQVPNVDTSYTFTGQSQGATLTYSVRAVNSVGHGLSDSQSVCVSPCP